MPKDKLTSNVLTSLFAVVALTVAGCGGSGGGTGGTDGGASGGAKVDGGSTGGKGGAGGTGSGGKAATGGSAGGGAGGGASTGGAGGSSTGGAAGGSVGGGGAGGKPATGGAGGSSTGGAAGGGGSSAGGKGGGSVCAETPVCTLNAVRCTNGAPQKCLADTSGCPNWVAQAACGAHQVCNATTGACDCQNDARCMAKEGSFCPTAGATTFAQCTKDGSGCFTVTAENQTCTSPQTCAVTGVVATGTACGCPANGTRLGTGCGNKNVGDELASPADDATLACTMVGSCKIWKIKANCADSGLTAGTEDGTGRAVCVCKAAGTVGDPKTLYVDPNPDIATSMNGKPTGVLSPPACRLPRITDALDLIRGGAPFNRVVVQSTTSTSFTNETLPMQIPAGVEVTTADGPSFQTSHYTIVLSGAQMVPMIEVANGASLSGFTINGTAAAGATAVLASTTGTGTIDLHHLKIVAAPASVGIAIRGGVSATATLVDISGASVGLEVTRTQSGTTAVAKLTGSQVTSTSSTVGARVGTGLSVGQDSGVRSSLALTNSSLAVANGDGIAVTGGDVTLTTTNVVVNGSSAGRHGVVLVGTTASLSTSGGKIQVSSDADTLTLGAGSPTTGVDARAGSATLNATPVTVGNSSVGASVNASTGSLSLTGLALSGGNSSVGVSVAAGTATLSGVTLTVGNSSVGVDASAAATATIGTSSIKTGNGSVGLRDAASTATLSGSSVTVGSGSSGVVESGASTLKLTGTSTANTILTTSVTNGSTDGDGLTVSAGSTAATLTIDGNTSISKFRDGLVVLDGKVVLSGGNIVLSGNTRDGAVLANTTETATNPATVSLTSVTLQNNGGIGANVNSEVLTTLTTCTITGNTGDGVQVHKSPTTGPAGEGIRFVLSGSTINLNKGRGVAFTGASQVGARVETNKISANALTGLLVSDGAAEGTTFVTIKDNDIFGNLTAKATLDSTKVLAGGVWFTNAQVPGTPVAGLKVQLTKFLGNKVHGNGFNQIGFDLAQADATPWVISSDTTSEIASAACDPAAKPNSVYDYCSPFLGVAVSNPAISVTAKGLFWAAAPPVSMTDFSPMGVTATASCSPALGAAACLP